MLHNKTRVYKGFSQYFFRLPKVNSSTWGKTTRIWVEATSQSLIIDYRPSDLFLSKARHLSKWRECNASLVGTWGSKQCPKALLFTLVLVGTESLFSRESGHDCLNKIVTRSRNSDSASADSKGTSNSSTCLAFWLNLGFLPWLPHFF